MCVSVKLTNWVFIYSPKSERTVEKFLISYKEACKNINFELTAPKRMKTANETNRAYEAALEQAVNCDPMLIMVLAHSDRPDLYGLIKSFCCVKYGIPSQVVLARNAEPSAKNPSKLMSVAQKIAIQINCKIGGLPWHIHVPLNSLMVVGFDVYHDSQNKKISYGALVSSMDLKSSQKYYSGVTPHSNGEELSNHINIHFTNALKEFRRNHGTYPEKIFFYRDGVGDGQVSYY